MGKYGELIREAKAESGEPENQITDKPDNQTARKPATQKTRKPDSQIRRKMENQKTRKQDNQTDADEAVNLGVKVPLRYWRHWAAQSKLTGISMTEVIIAALIAEFGKPE